MHRLRLQLTLNRPAAGRNPNEYILLLTSDIVAEAEKQAERARGDEEREKARALIHSRSFDAP